jgi:sulfoxide reductase catalytic subunit YedY
LVHKPRSYDVDDLIKRMPLEERVYRFRCVEAWSMVVPWTGFPVKALLEEVQPMAGAKFVQMTTFLNPEVAPRQQESRFGFGEPWPYTEGLTIAEATNELTLFVVGIYGHLLPKQHGAPIRLIVPWKYGFKSIKSIVKIELTEKQPATFWNTLVPSEYGFESNVNPRVPHPRWSQAFERVIGTGARIPTQLYNGYAAQVAQLYPRA